MSSCAVRRTGTPSTLTSPLPVSMRSGPHASSGDARPCARRTAGSAATTLSPDEIVRKVEAAGYRDVRDVEYDDGRWEAEAIDKSGKRVDLRIDPASGAVVLDED
ncbi:MAG: PepSY domain-containing protein [Thermodesulfobacteriota bacterium]